MLGDERSGVIGGDVKDDLGAVNKPRRGRPPNKLKEAPVSAPTVNMEQLAAIFAKRDEAQQKNLIAAIQELKKPTPQEQAKLDKEAEKLAREQKARMALAKAEEQRKINQKVNCRHATIHPGTGVRKHQWRAQVHTPHGEKPYFQPLCTQCFTQGPKILATSEMLQNGVNLDQYADLDLDRLEAWAKSASEAA